MKRFGWVVVALFGLAVNGFLACDFEVDEPEACQTDVDCAAGLVCQVSTGACVECVSDSQCPTGKHCSPASNTCVACTKDAHCEKGVCSVETNFCVECLADTDCPSGKCDEENQICIMCGEDKECDDGNPCTVNSCDGAGQCVTVAAADGIACDDGDKCTDKDVCSKGSCGGTPIPGCEVVGPCQGQPDGTDCDDGDKCTLDDFCFGGECKGDGIAPECKKKDLDGDGFTSDQGDCDDQDAAVFPGAQELCNGKDDDCDNVSDEDCPGPCIVSGCSAEICAEVPMESDCQWLPEYDCLQYSQCTWGPDGACGWLQTDEYLECLAAICTPSEEVCDGMDNDCDGLVDEDGCSGVCGGFAGFACPEGMFCMFEMGTCGWADQMGVCLPMPEACYALYAPVCGCDGMTYGNDCEAMAAGVSILHEGECEGPGECWATCDCYKLYGEKFSGQCPLACMGCGMFWQCENGLCVEQCDMIPPDALECTGTCIDQEICFNWMDDDCDGLVDEGCEEPVCTGDWDCDDGDLCTVDACMNGICVHKMDPNCAGDICGPDMPPCAKGSYCFTPTGQCGFVGLCQPLPDACYFLYDPVCGCDGVTYSNDCVAASAGQSIAYWGECGAENLCEMKGGKCFAGADDTDPNGGFCPVGFEAVDLPGCQAWESCCLPVQPECFETCDCYNLYGNKFPEPCPLLCVNCDNYWQCENGTCVDKCGWVPEEVQKCLTPCLPEEICDNGMDDDCDGMVDEDCQILCLSDKECDDGDACTKDGCINGVCVNVAIPGCLPSGCWLNEQCPKGQYCRFPDFQCDNAKSGKCTAISTICPDVWMPVCGCDGNTYGNECEMQAAMQSMAAKGECAAPCVKEGDSFMGNSGSDNQCCAGLVAVWECQEMPANCGPDGNCLGFSCSCPKCLCFVCTQCGNGDCGLGENKCSCPSDCLKPGECIDASYCDDGDECTKDACSNGLCVHEKIPGCVINCKQDVECGAGLYCQFPDGTCGANVLGVCTQIPEGCTKIYDPVCGCDGVTYGNPCMMQMAKKSMKYEGECKVECIPEGGTYFGNSGNDNQCCAGLKPIFECMEEVWCDPAGGCKVGCACPDCYCFVCAACGNGKCGIGENSCSCPTDCKPPLECSFDKDCDDANKCTKDTCVQGKCLHEKGQEICKDQIDNDCDGQIDEKECLGGSCGGIAGLTCAATNQYCKFAPATCNIMDNMGTCTPVPTMCPSLWAPVCGCDGKTYGNECTMEAAKMSKKYDGECAGKCKALDPNAYGFCDMILGWAFNGKECLMIIGCSCGNDCAFFFKTSDECKKNCL
jgi:hypothetical protein